MKNLMCIQNNCVPSGQEKYFYPSRDCFYSFSEFQKKITQNILLFTQFLNNDLACLFWSYQQAKKTVLFLVISLLLGGSMRGKLLLCNVRDEKSGNKTEK